MAGRVKKVLGTVVLVIVAVILAGITLTIGWRPVIGAQARALTDRRFEANPLRLERGRYLVQNVMGCFDCHSEHDLTLPGEPPKKGTEGGGRIFFPEGSAFPGKLVASNISPDPETGAGKWSDDMLARSIREGIGHDGRALFPLMPYLNYRDMPDEDLASVIVYLRSIPPVKNALPKSEIQFPLSRLFLSAPQPLTTPVGQPDLSDSVKHGEFIAKMASCSNCHTAEERGAPKKGLEYAGGFVFELPEHTVASANITPDPSGISYYDEPLFLEAMRTGKVKARNLNAMMPWAYYHGMNDEDLKALWAYVKALPPVKHRVDNAEPPTPCKLCGNTHGAGDKN
ncbi:MAG TPA: c-type cytochrome [Blastocatellia bacterium]|nr:c-type cytochrome [Blastocatellia bacterium]